MINIVNFYYNVLEKTLGIACVNQPFTIYLLAVCVRKYSNRFFKFIMTGKVAPPIRPARKERRISIKLPKYRLELRFKR